MNAWQADLACQVFYETKQMKFRIIVSTVIVFALSLLIVPNALAHGGEPRLEISVERINPGGVVEVRGVDFDYEESVALSLMRSKIQIPLREVTADVEGIFIQTIVLPADLPAGEYNFLARTTHHLAMSPTITVWGAAIQDQEDNNIRDQSDVQLEPMLTVAPSVAATPLPQISASESESPKGIATALIYSIVFGAGVLALLSIRFLKKK
jgi:hypothetical protein